MRQRQTPRSIHRLVARGLMVGMCGIAVWWGDPSATVAAHAQSVSYQIITNEVKAKQSNGSEIEVYRFDPAVFVVNEGDDVTLQIRGFKGHDHPVVLEGYNLKAVVHRNQTTSLKFHAAKPGFYRLLCTSHIDAAHEGPMEGYVVVVPAKK